jgi:MFS family permease
MIITRLVTGIGVGGMLPSLNTMVAEYSSDRRRQLAVSFLQVGYPVGAIVAGVVSVYLISRFGWRSVFVCGGFLSILMLPLIYFRLPESLDFLLNRQPRNALRRVNTLLRQLRQPEVSGLPQLTNENANTSGISVLTSSTYRARTLFICVAFLIVMSAWYFVINWTPKILVDAGLSLNAGISGGLLISVGGVAGGLSLGFLSTRFQLRRLVATFMLSGAVVMTLFGQLDTQLSAMLVTAFAIGFCLAGAMIGLYAIVADAYPVAVRSTGTGWAIGIGRLGAVTGPYVAGLLIAAGWDRALYFFTLAMPLVVAMILVLRLPGRQSGTEDQVQGRLNFEKTVK